MGAKIIRSSPRFNKQCCSVVLTNRSPIKGAVSGRNGSRDSCLPDAEEFQECTVTSRWCNSVVGTVLTQVPLSCGSLRDTISFNVLVPFSSEHPQCLQTPTVGFWHLFRDIETGERKRKWNFLSPLQLEVTSSL